MSNPETQKTQPALHRIGFEIYQWLASLQLAIVLLVFLGGILAVATLIDKQKGLDYAQWCVYHSPWFLALLGLLALNVLASILIRYPWGLSRIGFLMTHIAILMILAGAMWTFLYGVEGLIGFVEGETVSRYAVPKVDKITAARSNQTGNRSSMASVWTFMPGPTGWDEKDALDLKFDNGIWLKVLRYYPNAQLEKKWLPDKNKTGKAAIEYALVSSDDQVMQQDWLSADIGERAKPLGPAGLFLFQAEDNCFVEDFNNPLDMQSDSYGVLSIYCNGQKKQVPVKENIGKTIDLSDDGLAVKIESYLPDARTADGGKDISASDQPENPMLEIQVYLPGKDEPQRQIVFSRFPTFNLGDMHGKPSPVKFWYHHPVAPTSIEFLSTPNGKIHCRAGSKGKYTSQGEVKIGGAVDVMGHFRLKVLQYLPSALHEEKFVPVDASQSEPADGQQAAALIAIDAEGAAGQVWMHKDDPEYATQEFPTRDGTVTLHFSEEEVSLPFSLKLVRVIHGLNPGGMGDASFGSVVRLVDRAANVDKEAEISMNNPLAYGKYAFYQSAIPGDKTSVLSVGCDPGRFLKYAGSYLLCLGVFVIFYLRIPRLKNGVAAACALGALLTASGASAAGGTTFDWDAWRSLPVLDNGRHKPFDTLAKETARIVFGGVTVTEPDSGKKLDYVEAYLSMLFQWEPDNEASPHHMGGSPGYFAVHKPDKWDDAPILPVKSGALREALSMPSGEKCISPIRLTEANYTNTHKGRTISFIKQVDALESQRAQRRSSLDKKTWDLAEALWVYEQSRRGETLYVVPVPGTKGDEWISAAQLMRGKFDDSNDPKGLIRKIQEQFIKAKKSFLANDSDDFNATTKSLLSTAREMGEQTDSYPTQQVIQVEMAYNRYAPFRIAWIFCAGALVLSLSVIVMQKRFIYILAISLLVAALIAVLAGFAMRTIVSGRAPVTNMFESVVYMGLGVIVFGLVFEFFWRKGILLAAAAAFAAITLVLADNCPVVLDPALKPLTPVLRSNYWLIVHVMTIVLSYAALGLAWLIGNITLGFYLASAEDIATMRLLGRYTYHTLKAGFLLLIIGTLLGAFWADDSWGRFWGWDAKEVWALVTLLFYAALLHARRIGWVGNFGLAVWSVVCFLAVIMAWYGVNFLLGVGLHSYGSSSGGQEYVIAAMIVQMFYVLAAVIAASLNPNADKQSLQESAA